MEALLVLLGLAVLALPVAVIFLIFAQVRLRRDFRAVQGRLQDLERSVAQNGRPAPRGAGPRPVPLPVEPRPQQIRPVEPANAAPPPVTADPPLPSAPPQPTTPTHPTPQPKGPSGFDRLFGWLQENWFYAIAAVSLALAGIFLVQYGVETGLLTPGARVIAALVFGGALIVGGETIRRRFGDGADKASAYLPSVLSGAGLVSLMGGILAARLLYDLVAPGPALAALFGIALFGLVLGWRHGPLLAAIGLIGGMAAPFLVGGESDNPEWLLVYFGLLAMLGLGIDTLRRWAWVSLLSVALGFGAAVLLHLLAPSSEPMMASLAVYAVALVLASLLIPSRALSPDHQGTCLTGAIFETGDRGRPIFPVILSCLTLLAGCVLLAYTAQESALTWRLSAGLTAGLGTAMVLWSRGAPALQDQAALPVLTLLALIAGPDLNTAMQDSLTARFIAGQELTEQRMMMDFTLILLAAVLTGLAAAWRSLQPGGYPALWAGAAALIAPLAGLALEFGWQPAMVIGAWPWALHALALAALMVAKAARFARADKEDRLRPALATVSALACIAFALTLLLTSAALTLALAAVVVSAAALDRRFDLPQMTGFIAAGIVALGYRLVFDPGLDWAFGAPVLEMLATYGGTLAALLSALWLGLTRPRPRARVLLESAAWSVGGMTVSLTLFHAIEAYVGHVPKEAHWGIGLYASIWICTALAQLERLRLGGPLRWVRVMLAGSFGLMALGFIGLGLSFGNPVFEEQTVHGVIVLNTLIPAYLLPAVLLGLGALRLTRLRNWLRVGLGVLGVLLALVWAGLVIRHAWQGGTLMHSANGITDGELYSYTVALLLAGAGLFYRALAHRSDLLRRAGVAVIALAVAKVFLIDISGLAGLVRVFSFLLLGLSLAGLAWFNRWVQTRAGAPLDG
ncbi:DUF2339 domain-containing protein [Mameliella alba]|nr:DUF2339 domain-containing protein [Antarctobacter heliothermus]MBY6143769.1 DUF2339 domain-containing protein [Mameliella alba]MCA0952507.1 DUF2339 domain-containing protein [Mameliella alba]